MACRSCGHRSPAHTGPNGACTVASCGCDRWQPSPLTLLEDF